MMTKNGGFQSFYPSNQNGGNQQYNNQNGYNGNSFHRSNTYMPHNPHQNNNYLPPPTQNVPQQNLRHSNTFMPQQPQYQPQPQNFAQQNPYIPPQNQYMTPQNQYLPPQNQMSSQNHFLNRSNTYMPQSPYQNPEPMYPPQNQEQQYMNQQQSSYIPQPPQSPFMGQLSRLQRSNTYYPPAPRRETIYDKLDINPRRFVPEAPTNTNNNQNIQFGTFNFDPEADCTVLRNAVHGWGTDEKAIINVIVNRNAAQRAEIRRTYKACFGKDLIKRLKEDTSGNFKEVICAMFMTPAEYDAYCLYRAMKGLGTDEGALIEIIGTRNCQQLQEIKDIFEKEYKNSLENWIVGDTSFNFKLLLVALLQCNRSNNPNPDINKCQADAQALYNAGEGRLGTDEATFIRIFANRSAAEIACINQCYLKMRGKGVLHAIDKNFSGDIKKLLQTVVGGLLDIHGYFAMRIREAVRGLGTNTAKLVRVIVSRCEIDLPQIKDAYRKIYNRDLLKDVRDDTSGYYRQILTSLISRC